MKHELKILIKTIVLSFFILPSCHKGLGNIQSSYLQQGKEAVQRLNEWKGSDEVIVFPIITDIHAYNNDNYKHIGYIAKMSDMFGYDFMANLGDIGLNMGVPHYSKSAALDVVNSTLQQMSLFSGVFIFAPGNHDWDAGEDEYFSEQYLSDTFQLPSKKHGGDSLHLTPGKCYGYYDIPNKKARVIFLNSQATRTLGGIYYFFGDEQLLWLKNLLDSTDPDTEIILLSHYSPHPIGRWKNSVPQVETLESNQKIMSMLSIYQNSRQIVALFSGDSHVNCLGIENGIHYFISQGYGWCKIGDMLTEQLHAFFDSGDYLCCDIIVIKPQKNEVMTFRIGAGGSAFDYYFTY